MVALSDYIIFWEKHRERPPLTTGVVWGGGKYEVLKDDGRVVWKSFESPFAKMEKQLRDAINEMETQWR